MITSQESAAADEIPDRYESRETEAGRSLRCRETPGVAVRLERKAYTEAEARKLGERVILLDGAGSFAPLLDNEKLFYNLDHHEDCVRAFMLSSCEQAMTLVVKGLQLDKGSWTIYANEPDLDTVFAIWVLLNHRRFRDLAPDARDRIVPLFRLEGAIDANGFEVAEYCGLPRRAMDEMRQILDRLQAIETETKATGSWHEMDLHDYTRMMLLEVDKVAYESDDLHDFEGIEEEYDDVEIGDDRVAVVCRDANGIYEVEQRLKKVWGDKLGIVALETGTQHYTLRRAAALAKIDLGAVYARLNRQDPAVDGRPPDKRWGGSDEIGGSPRPGGSRLRPKDVATVLYDSFHPQGIGGKIMQLATAVLFTAALGLVGWAIFQGTPLLELGRGHPQATPWGLSGLATILAGAVLVWQFSGGRPWLYGVRRWAGRDWWLLAPAIFAGSLLGAAWTPRELGTTPSSFQLALVIAVLGSLGAELWFRGFVHGLFVQDSTVQDVGGKWFLSLGTIVSGVLYAAAMALGNLSLLGPSPLAVLTASGTVEAAVGGLVAGLALGMIRERSMSLWPGVGLQALGSLLLAALRL